MKETKELKKESELEKIKDDKLDSLKDKLSKIKTKIDKFQNGLLKKFDKYVVGIALLPPLKDQKDALDLLVLVDDGDSKKMPKLELRDKLNAIANNMAKEIDKNFRIDVMLLSEMTQNCYDNKTEFMKEIAMSASIYDPKDLIAAVKVSDVHKEMVLKKFEKYIISYVAAGSLFRGEKSNDIDVYVIVDDTDVKKMSRFELKEKLRAIILSQAFEANSITRVKKKFHVQVYILTDFWEGIKDANPVFFTLLRDGIPLYDRGVFMPWKLLLEMGRIKPSPEAIDTFVASGDKMMERVRFKLRNIMEEIFVKKEKLLEKRYIDILTEIRRYYKDLEHDKIKTLTGKDIDKLLKNANDYLKRIKKLFAQIEERKNEENMNEIYDTVTNLVKDVLKENEIDNKNLELGLRKLKDKNEISPKMLATFKDVEKAKKEREKISKPEFNKIRKDSRLLINQLMDHLQRKRFRELDKVTLRIKSNDKYSEIIILEDNAFIIDDIKRRDIVGLAKINKDGSLGEVNKSSAKELEENLDKKKIEKNVFVKEALFKSLKELFGKDMEILIGY